jgi:hypothetical protein
VTHPRRSQFSLAGTGRLRYARSPGVLRIQTMIENKLKFEVGALVRVVRAEDSARCVVLCDLEDGRYEVCVSGSGSELCVTAESIRRLLDFENLPVTSALEGKLWGNELFGLKDYAAAWSTYSKAVEVLRVKGWPTVGSAVIVDHRESTTPFRTGVVCNLSGDGLLSILFDEDDSEEDLVDSSRLTPLGQNTEEQGLCRALFMNLGRCCIKLHKKGWAVRWFSLALALTGVYASPDRDERMADTLWARGRVLLGMGRLQLADRDAAALRCLNPQRGEALAQEVQQGRVRIRRADRRLARDVAEWVEEAMQPRDRLKCENTTPAIDKDSMEDEKEVEEEEKVCESMSLDGGRGASGNCALT